MFRVWRRLLGLCTKTVLEDIEFDEDADAVIRWRGLDLGADALGPARCRAHPRLR